MHTLTLDLGNSRPSAILWTEDGKPSQSLSLGGAQALTAQMKDLTLAISQVHHWDQELSFWQHLPRLKVGDHWRGGQFSGMPVHYAATLGEDRLIQAWFLYNDKIPTLMIDAGTFITVDIINEHGFAGGHIWPGPGPLTRSYAQGEKLSPVSWEELPADVLTGKRLPQTTQEAMGSIIASYLNSLTKIIEQQHIQRIVFSGGHSPWLSSVWALKQSGPAWELRPDLVHRSLFAWQRSMAK